MTTEDLKVVNLKWEKTLNNLNKSSFSNTKNIFEIYGSNHHKKFNGGGGEEEGGGLGD